jgi:hypothetical protein
LKDIITALEKEAPHNPPPQAEATEVIHLSEDTSLLQALEELERMNHADPWIATSAGTNHPTHYLKRDMIFSAFYKVKELWK